MAKQINITAPPGEDAEQWVAQIKALARRHWVAGDIPSERITDLMRYYIQRDWDSHENQDWLATEHGRAARIFCGLK